MPDKEPYEVGYGKPPKHTRFKKGQSGNPKGRTKGIRNLKTDLLKELQERVTIRGKRGQSTITKQEALIKKLLADAASGKIGAMSKILDLIQNLNIYPPEQEEEAPLMPHEQQALEILEARIRQELSREQGNPNPAEDGDANDDEQ